MTDASNPANDAVPADRTKTGATPRRHEGSQQDEKHNIFSRIILFVRQTIGEMKKVRYPTREETWTYFLVVIAFVGVLMFFTGVVDLAFDKLSILVFD